MSLDQAIEHGKEKRKKYRGGKAICISCRNHGGCDWCLGNRTHKNDKRQKSMDDQLKEWEESEDGESEV